MNDVAALLEAHGFEEGDLYSIAPTRDCKPIQVDFLFRQSDKA
ncbi:MAG: hypothetical protein VW713_05810 [Alphaproteobacteria bacterium]